VGGLRGHKLKIKLGKNLSVNKLSWWWSPYSFRKGFSNSYWQSMGLRFKALHIALWSKQLSIYFIIMENKNE